MPKRNVELLQKTMQYIKDHPEQHDQSVWVNACGTAACFAGWAAMLSGAKAEDITIMTGFAVAKLLGLTVNEARALFYGENTIPMLELIVKDLVNDDELQDWHEYQEEARNA